MKRRKPVIETYHAILSRIKQETRNDTKVSRTYVITATGLSWKYGMPYINQLVKVGLLKIKENGIRRYLTLTQQGEEILAQISALLDLLEGTK